VLIVPSRQLFPDIFVTKYIISHLFTVVDMFISVAAKLLAYHELNNVVTHFIILYVIPSEFVLVSHVSLRLLTIFIFAFTGERRARTASQ
jgi:hypothetical protein